MCIGKAWVLEDLGIGRRVHWEGVTCALGRHDVRIGKAWVLGDVGTGRCVHWEGMDIGRHVHWEGVGTGR